MYSPANTVTGRRHATTVTGQCDLVVRDAAAPSGEMTGERLETSGVLYPGVSEESHGTTRGSWCVGRPHAALSLTAALACCCVT
jgi:hypothetical protein